MLEVLLQNDQGGETFFTRSIKLTSTHRRHEGRPCDDP